ncbi:MFS transporter [Paeniglutamicibacter psychrophenolicus]|uniref:MHS family alpha-ketoglutarate permease-like MFS transporter n=1 Tax=Paeniglutamicibacter psychrophenolicus TaxID=257454 RepID=A0ABS4WHC3_9MICC|nr:MFS transporter [Paeniglutamicibacter psychrophenolicus]MBP2375598.1 MHS family alpha-ketoglutarate permease-like MFS transporter [Paeniglutamicibacter psychrophenolicus]
MPLHQATAPSPTKGRSYRTKQLMAASVGNAVEWFDWYVYSMLAVYFATQFFPAEGDSLVPLLSTLAIFAVGFFARPLGGLLIGLAADRYGRRRVLSLTIVGMGVGSLMIGLAPTYAQVGIVAPIILLVARLIQGASAGGEYAAGSAFLIESAPEGKRGLFSSFFYISATAANLLAIGISALLANTLDAQSMATWGWRIPFILGSLAAVVGMWVRKHAEETLPELEKSPAKKVRVGMFDFFREHPRQALQIFGLTAAPALAFYVWTAYLPTYASITVGFDLKRGLMTGVISLSVFLVLQPIFGALSDKVGRKPFLLTFGLFFTVGTVPLLNSLQPSFGSLLFVQVIGLVFIACWSSVSSAVVSELFPARLRSSGIGFPYAAAVALFGGTGPYVATYLVSAGNAGYFAWYVAALALISTVVFAFMPETAHRPLR